MNLTHGSLFSGVGGFDLAAERMGWKNKFHCEWNPFGQRVLKYYWPQAESFIDITKSNFKNYANRIDVLTGGFPCQPYSTAGKRKGKADERHLWPEMLRAIREIKPTWIVGENVLGLVNWNGGLVFEEVQTDLEAQGYEVQPFILPACATNAPHRRERVWFIAYSYSNGLNRRNLKNERQPNERGIDALSNIKHGFKKGANPNTDGGRFQRIEKEEKGKFSINRNAWDKFPTQSAVCNGNDGISSKLDGITFSNWREESIKAGGNAIVSQVAINIFESIENYISENE